MTDIESQRTNFAPQQAEQSSDDTSGIRDISRQHTVITALSARTEYRFTRALSGLLDYTLRDYNEKNPAFDAGNGTVHVVVASVAAKW